MRFSFKTRVVGITVLASAITLAVCTWLLFMRLIHDRNESIDLRLLTLCESQMRGPHRAGHWTRFSETLDSLYIKDGLQGDFSIKVIDGNRDEIFRASDWPKSFEATVRPLPAPDPTIWREELGDPMRRRSGGPSLDRPRRENGPRRPGEYPGPSDRPNRPGKAPPPLIPLDYNALQPIFTTVEDDAGKWRVCSVVNPYAELSIAVRLDSLGDELNQFIGITAIGAPVLLLLMGFIAWFMANHSLRTVQRISNTASEITSVRLDARIPEQGDDREFAELIRVINGMLARLEVSYQQATRFSADASHELNTPLTILHGELEHAVQHATDESNQQQMAALLEEVQHLKNITRKLLMLSKADTGQLSASKEMVNLSLMVEEMCDDIPLLDPEVKTEQDIEENVMAHIDRDILQQAIQNLINNALSYVSKDGTISVKLHRDTDYAYTVVGNTAEPIAADKLPHIFDRFFRVDAARTRGAHTGLGLSLVREIARAHDGEIACTKNEDGMVEFTLTIPLG